MKHILTLLLIAISLKSVAIADTLLPVIPNDFKRAFVKVYNSEDYYHNAYYIHQMRIDSLTKAVDILLGSKGLVLRTEAEIGEVIKNYNALEEGMKSDLNQLKKDVKRERRRKNFWKIVSGVMTGVALYIAVK